jgi:hypothetical protein
VNAELFPLFSMTCPDLDMRISPALALVGPGAGSTGPLFRSWLLLFGLLPIDYDDINLVAVIEGKSFSERSSMALMSQWHHDRVLETSNDGTVVTDELAFVPRVRLLGWLLTVAVRVLFAHRHRRLVSVFGCAKETSIELTYN